MSNLREKAREIKAAGEAERGNFEPTGAPKRLYQYWLNESNSRHARDIRWGDKKENFCHFWRVVAIWAPLMFLRRKIEKAAPVIGAVLAVAALIALVWACIVSTNVLMTVGFIALAVVGLALGIAGLVAGMSAALSEEERIDAELIRDKKVIAVLFILGLPTALLGFAGGLTIKAWDGPLRPHRKKVGFGIAVVAILSFYTMVGITASLTALFWWIAVPVGILIGGFVAVFVGSLLSDYISGKRALATEKKAAEREAYYEEHGHYPVTPTREPDAIDKFFRAVGDFIVLIGQIVRVNKWKICPLVEVDASK